MRHPPFVEFSFDDGATLNLTYAQKKYSHGGGNVGAKRRGEPRDKRSGNVVLWSCDSIPQGKGPRYGQMGPVEATTSKSPAPRL